MPVPDQLDAAYEALENAQRFGTPEDVDAAAAELGRVKDIVACRALLALNIALERCPAGLARVLRRMVDDIVKHACDVANAARRQAKFAADEASGLRARIVALEEQVARLIPGLGDPARVG